MNSFGDLLSHEFTSKRNGYRQDLRNTSRHQLEAISYLSPENIQVPEEVDWREKGAVREHTIIPNFMPISTL